MLKDQKGLAHLGFFILLLLVLLAISFIGWKVFEKNRSGGFNSPANIFKTSDNPEEDAIKAGKFLSGGKCHGTDKLTFTHLPMREEDFSILIPYGLVVGGHVSPIDHQYFGPADFKSPRDAYPVYAMADATITEITQRTNERGTEYRFVFAYSCTSLYYYDLVTSLVGKVKEAYEKDRKNINLPVKAGEQVGKIGGQTLDFAVWNTEKRLTGFIVPEHYEGEAWKIFTDDPYPYYTSALRQLLIERNPRTTEPIAGKIDYDIDGKLIGNWFQVGTNGYHAYDNRQQEYWKGHISFVPNHYDTSVFVISIGDFGGQAMQFVALGNNPNPAAVDTSTGLVKYQLRQYSYIKADGSFWDGNSITKNPKVRANMQDFGCILVQLTAARNLKAEPFPNKSCSSITNFTASAKTYER